LLAAQSMSLGPDPGRPNVRSAATDLLHATTAATKEAFVSAKENVEKHKKTVIIGTGVVATGVGAVVAAPLVISAAGFTAGGVAAGSLAAAWQSSIGSVAAGSVFASLQSAGVLGLAATTKAAVGVAAGGVGGLLGKAFSSKVKDERDVNDADDDDDQDNGVTDRERNDEKNHVQNVKEDENLCDKKEEEADEGIGIENETVDNNVNNDEKDDKHEEDEEESP